MWDAYISYNMPPNTYGKAFLSCFKSISGYLNCQSGFMREKKGTHKAVNNSIIQKKKDVRKQTFLTFHLEICHVTCEDLERHLHQGW